MKIRIMSDLHLHRYDEFKYTQLDEDVAVFAGDLANGSGGLNWIEQQNITVPTIFVPGNHEYYTNDFKYLNNNEFKQCKHTKVLRNGVFELDDVVFIGATLWTDFAFFNEGSAYISGLLYARGLNDCYAISNGDRVWSPDDALEEHNFSMQFIREVMKKNDFSNKTKVLVSHHCAYWSVSNRYIESPLTPGFANSFKESSELASMFDVWIHGHTHDFFNYKIGDCRIVCNPRGYSGESSGFFDDFILEV